MIKIKLLDSIQWAKKYPKQEIVRQEIDIMCNIIVRILLKIRSKKEIKGIYLKGSANKRWDTIIDYVPEISDLDIHILFRNDAVANDFCSTFDEALKIKSRMEMIYQQAFGKPMHIPRPQITIITHLTKQPYYEPSRPETVKVLFGAKYPTGNFSYKKPFKKAYIKMILSENDFLAKYPMQIVDKPSKYNFTSLRLISWRISAIGPKILALQGIPRQEAWSLNHTGVYCKLLEIGYRRLAHDYVSFYRECWKYFLSHYQDDAIASNALTSGVNILKQAITIAGEVGNE